jgi:hypothetical protein
VVCSFPWYDLILIIHDLAPYFGTPIQYIYGVKPCFIQPTTPKHNNSIIFTIIMERTVASLWRHCTECLYFNPLHGAGVVHPNIIHIHRIYISHGNYQRSHQRALIRRLSHNSCGPSEVRAWPRWCCLLVSTYAFPSFR